MNLQKNKNFLNDTDIETDVDDTDIETDVDDTDIETEVETELETELETEVEVNDSDIKIQNNKNVQIQKQAAKQENKDKSDDNDSESDDNDMNTVVKLTKRVSKERKSSKKIINIINGKFFNFKNNDDENILIIFENEFLLNFYTVIHLNYYKSIGKSPKKINYILFNNLKYKSIVKIIEGKYSNYEIFEDLLTKANIGNNLKIYVLFENYSNCYIVSKMVRNFNILPFFKNLKDMEEEKIASLEVDLLTDLHQLLSLSLKEIYLTYLKSETQEKFYTTVINDFEDKLSVEGYYKVNGLNSIEEKIIIYLIDNDVPKHTSIENILYGILPKIINISKKNIEKKIIDFILRFSKNAEVQLFETYLGTLTSSSIFKININLFKFIFNNSYILYKKRDIIIPNLPLCLFTEKNAHQYDLKKFLQSIYDNNLATNKINFKIKHDSIVTNKNDFEITNKIMKNDNKFIITIDDDYLKTLKKIYKIDKKFTISKNGEIVTNIQEKKAKKFSTKKYKQMKIIDFANLSKVYNHEDVKRNIKNYYKMLNNYLFNFILLLLRTDYEKEVDSLNEGITYSDEELLNINFTCVLNKFTEEVYNNKMPLMSCFKKLLTDVENDILELNEEKIKKVIFKYNLMTYKTILDLL